MATQLEDKPGNQQDDDWRPGSVNNPGLAAGDPSDPRGDLANREQSGDTPKGDEASKQEGDKLGKGYTGKADAAAQKPSRSRRALKFTKRRGAVGLITVLLAGGGIFGGFSLLQGPAEFIQLAHVLESIHFTSISDAQDDRFLKSVRYLYFAKNGSAERARLGYLGNKYADKFEAKIKAQTGLDFEYNRPGGFRDRITIDREHPNFEGKDLQQIQAEIDSKYPGVKVTEAGGETFIDARANGLDGYIKSNRFTKPVMTEAGYKWIPGAIGSHYTRRRAGVTYHPIKKIDNKINETSAGYASRLKEWAKERYQTIKNGANTTIATEDQPKGQTDAEKQANQAAASDAKTSADQTIQEGVAAAEGTSNGDLTSKAKFQDSIKGRLALGGGAGLGVACLLKGFDDNATSQNAQNIRELKRLGGEMDALGGQTQSGIDTDLETTGFYKKLLYQPSDPANNIPASSWTNAQSIKAELGQPGGIAPDDTLSNLYGNTPFHFLNEGAIGAGLGVGCGAVVQTATLVIGFFGGVASTIVQTAVSAIATPKIEALAANWLSNNAVDPFASGADAGNNIIFRFRLLANEQGIAAGGSKLSTTEEAQQANAALQEQEQTFKNQNLAYKIFSPTDSRSVFASLINSQPIDTSGKIQNLASLALSLPQTFTHMASMLGNIFAGKAHAVVGAGTWDYGFGKYSWSQNDLDDANYANPYQNADAAMNTLESPDGQQYIDRAATCYTVNIAKAADGKWDVTAGNDEVIDYKAVDDPGNHCNDDSATWKQIRFFIIDTETMDSMGCYEGDDDACASVSVGTDTAGATATNTTDGATTPVSNDVQDLARQLLTLSGQGKIGLDGFSDNPTSDRNDRSLPSLQLEDIANGQPAHGTTRCSFPVPSEITPDPALMQFLVDLAQKQSYTINALFGQCHSSAASNHYKGKAVDFGCPFDPIKANGVGEKYGIFDGTGETCANAGHYHYSIGGN